MRFPKPGEPEKIIENIKEEVRKLHRQHDYSIEDLADTLSSIHDAVATEIEEPPSRT